MPVESVDITYIAKIDDFKSQLKDLAKSSDATTRLLASQLSKDINGLNKAITSSKKGTGDATKGIKGLGDAAGQAGQASAKLRGILSSLAPSLGGIAGFANDAADGVEVLGASGIALSGPMAALGAAVAAAAAAYLVLTGDMARAEEAHKRQIAVLETVGPLYGQVRQAKLDDAVATGKMTEAQAADIEIQNKWQASAAATIAKLQEMKSALAKDVEPGILDTSLAFFGLREEADSLAHSVAETVGWAAPLAVLWDRDAEAGRKAAHEMGQLDTQITRVGIAAEKGAKADRHAADAKAGHAAAAKRLTEEMRALEAVSDSWIESMATEKSRIDSVTGSVKALLDAAEADDTARLSGAAKLAEAHEAEIRRLGEIAGAANLASKSDVERQSIAAAASKARAAEDERYEADLTKLHQEQADKRRELDEKNAADAQKIQDDQIAKFTSMLDVLGQGASMLGDSLSESASMSADTVTRLQNQMIAGEDFYSDAQKKAGNARVEAAKDTYRRQFNVAKAAKIAEAFASTQVAALNSLAQSPPPSPIGLIAAGITEGLGMASIAAISAQQPAFHLGGPMAGLAPDEVNLPNGAKGLRKEWALTTQGRSVIGDSALSKADAGVAPTNQVIAVSVYKHSRQVDSWKKDGLTAGDPIAKAISKGKLVGHRSR